MKENSFLLLLLLVVARVSFAEESVKGETTTNTTAKVAKSQMTNAAPVDETCTAPITFICTSDPGHNVAGPAPKPASQASEGGLWDSFVSVVSSWVSNGLFGSESSVTDPNRAASNDLKSIFYDGADTGAECYPATGKEGAYPDPSSMIVPQQDASYFHIFCGDTKVFHEKAETVVTSKLREYNVPPVLGPEETASKAGYFPQLPKSAENTKRKLRSTALIIVPGGSYSGLSLFESLVMPLQVLYSAPGEDTGTFYDADDFLPIVLQYRLKPPTPDAPIEDISKVVRMLERYRQKRLVSAMQYCADDEGDKESKDAPPLPKHDVTGAKNAFGGDDAHLGLSEAERNAAVEAQKRLSPSMLGLTDDFKIVIAGFSAGGHAVASYLAMASTIPIAAALLVYPVIAMDSPDIAHYHSTMNLLHVDPNITEPIKGAKSSARSGAVVGADVAISSDLPILAPPPAPEAVANEAKRKFAAADEIEGRNLDADETSTIEEETTTTSTTPEPTRSEYEVSFERYSKQRALLRRYSPNHHPANFPQCVYLTHTKTDSVVPYQHSELMYYSLVRHRKSAQRRVGMAVIDRSKQETSPASPAKAKKAVADQSQTVAAVGSAEASKSTSTLISSQGVGLRLYPEGPHGRWWISKDYPALREWWSEATAFLASNEC